MLDTLHIPITKVKTATGNATIEVDLTATKEDGTPVFSDEVYQHILYEGLKVILNSRMGGAAVGPVTKMTGKELELAQEAAMKIANGNLNDLKTGNIKHSRAKAKTTIPTAVRAEAMRIATIAIKDWIRDNTSHKPGEYSAKAYQAKAKEYIDSDPAFVEQARRNVEARKSQKFDIKLDLTTDLGQPVKKKTKSQDLPAGIVAKPTVSTVHRSVN